VSNTQRRKGRDGEAEVAAIYEAAGLTVRGLEGGGDHLVVTSIAAGVSIHSEAKRQETARPWAWWEQASTEAPPGALAVVAFRRNRSPWLALTRLDALAMLAAGYSPLAQHLRNGGDL
jgi:hypothetical protein